jgi:hypothetical protein
MAKLKVSLHGVGSIDNSVIYLEDPSEKIPLFLDPKNEKEWELDNIAITIDGELDYSLYVLAFSGTAFTCTISNEDNKKIELEGVTGTKIKNRAHLFGTKKFS